VLTEVDVHEGWIGRPLRALEAAADARVAYVTRYGDGILPDAQTVLQENDIVHLLMRADDSAAVERVITAAPVVEA
jgi:trk system potassium uptake protein TrkA